MQRDRLQMPKKRIKNIAKLFCKLDFSRFNLYNQHLKYDYKRAGLHK